MTPPADPAANVVDDGPSVATTGEGPVNGSASGNTGVDTPTLRARVTLKGAVQGVGFRPFIFRLATELGLAGWVRNTARGVHIEVEGARAGVQHFLRRLERETPPHSLVQAIEASFMAPIGEGEFLIRSSEPTGRGSTLAMPDLATCPECQAEIFDPRDRRYFYPFTNCTHCGPRFSILHSLPYDRPNTSMRQFRMCQRCASEYENPMDRRFHAQPNACPACGPQLELWDRAGNRLVSRRAALVGAAQAIRHGAILAVKGLGGFHLMVAATEEAAVRRLRQLKHREAKPFAVMCPSLRVVRWLCDLDPLEEKLLRSVAAPIVLLRRRPLPASGRRSRSVVPSVAPGNPHLGVLLPYTPLHHLLLRLVGIPVVATSGNHAEEPLCIDEHEALDRLGAIADFFLVHDRPILRPVDDSVARIVAGREQLLRRARGYAPLPITVNVASPTVLAVGAHYKNSVAIADQGQVFLSQHVGDLDNARACEVFRRATADLEALCADRPALVAADAHPDYHSTRAAQATGLPRVEVQHHYAHVLSCMAEHNLEGSLLGVAWDGTGLGPDGTIWGGEFLKITPQSWERVAHLRTFPLPGGEIAAYEPRRSALGLLYELFGDAAFSMKDLAPLRAFNAKELGTLKQMLTHQLNGPHTSSAGRLFDAAASLTDLRQRSQFEGQAAMDLEFAIDALDGDQAYPVRLLPTGRAHAEQTPAAVWVADWAPMIEILVEDTRARVPAWEITVKFHNALAGLIVTVARHVGQSRVVLSGGCFQNRLLTERTVELLRSAGFQPYWHQRVPPNDGGIALGQALAAARAGRARPDPSPRIP